MFNIIAIVVSVLSLIFGGWIGLLLAITGLIMSLVSMRKNVKTAKENLREVNKVIRRKRRREKISLVFSSIGITINILFLILYYFTDVIKNLLF